MSLYNAVNLRDKDKGQDEQLCYIHLYASSQSNTIQWRIKLNLSFFKSMILFPLKMLRILETHCKISTVQVNPRLFFNLIVLFVLLISNFKPTNIHIKFISQSWE